MLLDFLRLRSRYDRVCWNLKPVVLAHEILVRRGQDQAARIWRKALTERINDEADQYLAKLAELQKKYAMRMPTVADRLAERFVRPLTIDRIRALVAPAIEEAREGGEAPKFEMLQHDTEYLTREPTGVGLDVPAWLVALEEEVDDVCYACDQGCSEGELARVIPAVPFPSRKPNGSSKSGRIGRAHSRDQWSRFVPHDSATAEDGNAINGRGFVTSPRLEPHDSALVHLQRLFNLPAEDERLAGKLLLRREFRLQRALSAAGDVFQPRHQVVD